jgi:hypothetical protein
MRRLVPVLVSLAAVLVAAPAQADTEFTGSIGSPGGTTGQLGAPRGLGSAAAGRIYVTEYGNNQRLGVRLRRQLHPHHRQRLQQAVRRGREGQDRLPEERRDALDPVASGIDPSRVSAGAAVDAIADAIPREDAV